MLLAEGGEDEVGVGDGEEVALGLCAAVGSLPPDTSGADGDEGLADLVTGAAGVRVGVEEGVDAGLLVGLEALTALVDDDAEQGDRKQNDSNLLDADATEEESDDQDREVGQRGPEIRLDEDERQK